MTNAHKEMGQKAVCCQGLLLDAFSSHTTPSVPAGVLFKKFTLLKNTSCRQEWTIIKYSIRSFLFYSKKVLVVNYGHAVNIIFLQVIF